MFAWYFLAIPIVLIRIEIFILALYVIIKLITEKEIKFNYTKKTIGKFIVGNTLLCLLIIAISFGYNTYNFVGVNELGFRSQHEAKVATELLDKYNLEYKVLIGNKIRMENYNDVQKSIKLLSDSHIGFRSDNHYN